MAKKPSGVPVPFQEAIDHFRAKVRLPTNAWTDVWQEQHSKAFMVAGAAKTALLEDFQSSLAKALEQGTTLEEFRKDFDDIVQRHGWSYKGKRGWRTKVIYETNLRQSMAAGRWDQIQRAKKLRPYLRYVTTGVNTRPAHAAWHGLVYPVDHPFWLTHYPMNGWGCQCSVQSLSAKDVKNKGYTVSEDMPPEHEVEKRIKVGDEIQSVKVPAGIDPGFAYNPGQNRLSGVTPPPTPGAPAPGNGPATPTPMPAPRTFDQARLLPKDDLPDDQYIQAFLQEFGADIGKPVIFKDKAGASLPISEDLFYDAEGKSKVRKAGRQQFMRMLATSIKDPDEIWFDWERLASGRYQLRRRYISRFEIKDRQKSALSVFEVTSSGWREVTNFAPNHDRNASSQDKQLEKQRHGLLVYQRGVKAKE